MDAEFVTQTQNLSRDFFRKKNKQKFNAISTVRKIFCLDLHKFFCYYCRMKIETDAIILDIDGTLWDTTSVVAQAWNDAIENWICRLKK